jgi:uncharacterized protein involved in exopolysaccharide biosynthesis
MDPMNPIVRREEAPLRAPGAEPRELRGKDVLEVVFRRRRRILLVFLGVLAVAAGLTFARRPQYEVRASILVKYGSEYVYRPEPGQQRLPIALTPEEILNSEAAILTSNDLIRQVVETIGVDRLYPGPFGRPPTLDEAVRAFREDLDVESVRRSSVLQVSVRHEDPRVADEALQALLEGFERKHVSVFSEAELAFFERQLGDYERKLEESDRKLEAFRQEHGVFEYAEQMNLLLRRRAELDALHRQAGVELGEVQRRLAALNRSLEKPSPPEVAGAIQTDAIRLGGEAQSRQAREASLATLLDEVDGQIRELDRNARQLAALRREVAQDERNHETYRARVEEMRVASELNERNISNISVIDPGSVPTKPAGTRRAMKLVLGVVLAGLSAAVYALLAEYLSQGMATPEHVERRLDLPVLASVERFG